MDSAAVSRDIHGNIGYWALTQMRDVHQNFINYTYDKPSDCGEELYLREITYTGNGNEPGPYKITFLRTDSSNTFNRMDARIDARMGYVRRDKQLLRRVNITYNNEPIRSYTLQYKNGAFFKSLLESVSELDAQGNKFYTHRFDYFDDVQAASGYVPFAAEKKLDLPDDNLKNPFLNPINNFFDNISALGGSGSKGGSGNLTLTVGYNNFKLWDKSMTAGGNAGYSGSTGETFLSLMDINGDGLTDKVFKKDDNIYYRAGSPTPYNGNVFGEAKLVKGIKYLSLDKSNSFNYGFEANPPYSFVGYSKSKTKSKAEIYFSDFNGDGLIDLARKGVVYFNHIDENGEPVFTQVSTYTPNPINATSVIDPSILPNTAEEQAELEAQFPLQDAVRMWQAPYSGIIDISSPVKLFEDTSSDAKADTMKDGVKVSIQFKNSVKWSQIIEATDYSTKTPVIKPFYIQKGERIYFRVQSRFNGSYDKVSWDPEINYSFINGNDTLYKWEDVNRKKIARYKASEDFVLCGMQSVGMPKTGTVKFKTMFNKGVITDSIRLEILHTDSFGITKIELLRDFPDTEQIKNRPLDVDIHVVKDDKILFRISSSTNIDWTKIKWDAYFEYTAIDDGTQVKDNNGNPTLSFRVVPEYTVMYNNPVQHALPLIVDTAFLRTMQLDSIDNLPHCLKVTPVLDFGVNILNLPLFIDTVTLSAKTKNRYIGEHKYNFAINKVNPFDTLKIDIQLGDTVFFEYQFNNYKLMRYFEKAQVTCYNDIQQIVNASVYSVNNPEHLIFGSLYRGWGQFNYDGSGERTEAPIDESLLKVDEANKNVDEVKNTDDLNGMHDPMGDPFVVAVPLANRNHYLGADEYVYISPDTISSSRRGEKNIYVAPVEINGSGLTAFDKVTEDITQSVSVGGEVGPASASGSHSWGESTILKDMMDMNGDRYPDLLSKDAIQYTNVLGALSGNAVAHNLGGHSGKCDANGFTLGGSYVVAKTNNAMTMCGGSAGNKVRATFGDKICMDENASESEKTAKSSIGISANFSDNTDNTTSTWMDMNGDGLPDKVYSDGNVMLNLGYSFAPAENWGFSSIRNGSSNDFGGGLGINISNGSITGGIGLSKTLNESNTAFIDVNSDGLPDWINGSTVRINTGSGFADPINWEGMGKIDAGKSTGESANTGFTVAIGIPIIQIKICVNPTGSVNRGVNSSLTQLSDMDGDGYPDFLSSEKEGELYIKSSTINRTNMLQTVYLPMGSNFSMDYVQTPATYKHPGGKWALASVKSFDGLTGDGVDSSLVTFEYKNGFYNRHEHEFYGFDTVKTNFYDTGNKNKVYRTIEQHFSNSDYYTKGTMLGETLTDGNGRKQTGSLNTYELHNPRTGERLPADAAQSDSASVFVTLSESRQLLYEGASNPQITTRVTYTYDNMGNINGYTDYSTGNEKDKVTVTIAYHSNATRYLYSIPSLLEVITTGGLMRKRTTTINDYGDITGISQIINDNATATYDMEYDAYGNLTKITRPANYKGERMWYTYQYDSLVHTFVTRVTDAFGYSSSSAYDYKWGVPTETTDKNNQKMRYTFDGCGRTKTVTSPYEIAAGKPYTIAFEYYPEAVVPYAHTLHYDSVYHADIETYTFTDGMARPVQVKKTALLYNNTSGDDTPGYVVSGKVLYDAFGRATKAYQPVFEPATNANTYYTANDNIQPTTTTYDVLDRTLQVTLPDGAKTNRSYGFGLYNGETVHIDTLTDALGHQAVTYTDAKGQQVASVIKASAGDIVTGFEFNSLGELLAVTDPKGNKTLSVYDKLGRRTSVTQPDAGLTEFTYDAAGNLTRKITANLRKYMPSNGAITYKYDYERLVEIDYPRNIQNKVQYSYGAAGAPYGRAGRITLAQDASGGEEFFYGPLGETVKIIRTIQLSESDLRTWIWSATYDTWNRVQSMTYPDGEKVAYTYNRAGNLTSMAGEKLGRTYTYINRIGYDKYEKQIYLQYGNGSVTTYNYEPERQRLAQMSVTSNGKQLMDNTYKYDALSNILGITNTAAATGDIGGVSSHAYAYDDLNRLVQASGSYTGTTDTSTYTLAMQYDLMGNIMRKNQGHIKNGKAQSATTYDLSYKYDDRKPNAASEIGERRFTYDENGNTTFWEDTVANTYRQLAWDEENRLMTINDNGYVNNYTYDASGERVIKSHGGSQGLYIDGAPAGIVNHADNNYTVYVSPYFVMQADKFTKHYYAGSTRVTSKIGNGSFANQFQSGVFEITAGSINYINRQQQIAKGRSAYSASRGLPPGPPTHKGINADPYATGTAINDTTDSESAVPDGWPSQPVFAPAGGPPGAPIQWGPKITNETAQAGLGFSGTGDEEENLRYFYHSDHLGSTSYVTDASGNAMQYIAYMPFGEPLIEQHADWDSPYKFNAKELDSETGLYYYGARYYDPKVGRFISVDPLIEKFPWWSPYQFAGNEIPNAIDLDGLEAVVVVTGITSSEGKASSHRGKYYMYQVKIYENMTLNQYNSDKANGKLKKPDAYASLTRDAWMKNSKRSKDRYGSSNETPPGTYWLKYKKKGYGTHGYKLKVSETENGDFINGPDGQRSGIRVHQWSAHGSQGCFTTGSNDASSVDDFINLIPSLKDSKDVRFIVEPRSATYDSKNKIYKGNYNTSDYKIDDFKFDPSEFFYYLKNDATYVAPKITIKLKP
jgi:RHS repeat-associated protein